MEATISDHKSEEYISVLDNKLVSNDASQSIHAQVSRHSRQRGIAPNNPPKMYMPVPKTVF